MPKTLKITTPNHSNFNSAERYTVVQFGAAHQYIPINYSHRKRDPKTMVWTVWQGIVWGLKIWPCIALGQNHTPTTPNSNSAERYTVVQLDESPKYIHIKYFHRKRAPKRWTRPCVN